MKSEVSPLVAAALFLPWPIWLLRREGGTPPLAVHRGGRVVAACPLARRLGILPGLSPEAALARVPGLALHPYPQEAPALWQDLLRELHALTPWVEPLEPGVALLRLSLPEARLLARGHGARVGVAAWREVALLAAWSAREGEARGVAEGKEEAFLDRLPLHLLRGVGLTPEGLACLRLLGLKRVGELRRWKPPQLAAYLPEAPRLLPYLFGPWRKGVARFLEEETLEAEAFLDPPAEASAGLFRHLGARLFARLEGRAARRAEVEVWAEGLRFRGTWLAREPLHTEEGVRLALEAAFRKGGAGGLPLEAVRARLVGLFRPGFQEGLWRRADEGLKEVLTRFPGAFFRVQVVDPQALAPERGFRLVPWEVEDAALPLAGGGGVRREEAALGGVSG